MSFEEIATNIHRSSRRLSIARISELRCLRARDIRRRSRKLASDRSSYRSPLANPMRLILHTGADSPILTMRDAIPAAHALATAEFTTIRSLLLKLGTRGIETTSRVRLAFAPACPEAALFRHIAAALMPAGP
jgi:Transposase DDE domain group 1